MKTKNLILAITVPTVVILDQLSKWWAKATLAPLRVEMRFEDRYLSVIEDLFRFKFAENKGAAWGFLRDWDPSLRIPFFVVISLAAIALIVWFFRKLEDDQKTMALSFSLVLGGAVGNLIDRIHTGKVVDFIDWLIVFDEPWSLGPLSVSAGEHHWPTFNVADIGISVGVGLLMILLIFTKQSVGADPEVKEAEELNPDKALEVGDAPVPKAEPADESDSASDEASTAQPPAGKED